VARRPRSKASGPVRDVRALEEKRCLPRPLIVALVGHLRQVAAAVPRKAEMLAETTIWLRLRDAVGILLLLRTGLRRFEFLSLTCGDVDLDRGRLWVVGKNNNRDFVPLTDQAIALLTDWFACKRLRGESVDTEAPLFSATGPNESEGFMSFSALRLRWKKLLVDARLPTSYGIHSTRHAAGLIVFGHAGLEKTSRFLRHRSLTTTAKHYLHIDADELRRELSTIDL
jgi:integrase